MGHVERSAAQRLGDDVREMLREQHDYRELLYQMTRRDLLLRYKQTVMGFGWAVFMPVINTIIFSIVFMRVARIDVGAPYPLFAFCGLWAWNFFASAVRFALTSLTSNPNLVTKIYFPREIFPFSAVLVSLVDFAVGALLLAGFAAYYRIPPTPALLFLPVIVLTQIAFTSGLSLLLSMANLYYRDVKYIVEVVLAVGMFATSVLYPASVVGGTAGRLMRLNPMTPIIDAYRSTIFHGQLPDAASFAWATSCALVTLGAGWIVFHRAEFEFAEHV